jgi:uncharacterized protein YndB with AHSA1/START domain
MGGNTDRRSSTVTDATPTKELVITRRLDAPPADVYRAFTDPDQLAEWFGPVGFSVPRDTVDVDARVGGHQRLVMVNDDDPSMTSPVDATFTEVIENELLVGTEDVQGIPGLQEATTMTVRLEFHEEDGATELVIRQGPFSEQMEGMAREGWNSSFSKLEGLLARSR